MYLIELLLPVYDNEGHPQPKILFEQVRSELLERFGGVTAHVRSPAQGLWKEPGGETARDDVIILEVMSDSLPHEWWSDYRRKLEQRFRQAEIVIRAFPFKKI